jgi:two-component system, NarL family, response regulator NreC
MSTIRVLIADDHKIIRDGLKALVEKESGMEVIAEAESGREAVHLVQKQHPNVVIMDVSMPDMNGIEATRKIMEETPGVRVIALSMHTDRQFILDMLEAGACGYVLKDRAFEELTTAIRQVARGNTYICSKVAGVVVTGYLDKTPGSSHAASSILSPREHEVLQLLAKGMKAKVIAVRLNVSVKTIETYRRNIMDKLKLRSIAELTKYAVREGLVSLEG